MKPMFSSNSREIKDKTMIGIMNQAFTVHETSANLIYAFFSVSLHFFKPKHKHHYLYFEEES